jgi:hypothetical protein
MELRSVLGAIRLYMSDALKFVAASEPPNGFHNAAAIITAQITSTIVSLNRLSLPDTVAFLFIYPPNTSYDFF